MTAPPELTVDEILERLGLAGADRGEQRWVTGKLAYDGRLPLPWLSVLRQSGFLPYDEHRPED